MPPMYRSSSVRKGNSNSLKGGHQQQHSNSQVLYHSTYTKGQVIQIEN